MNRGLMRAALFALLAFALATPSHIRAQSDTTVVLLVRHAERASIAANSDLSAEGVARAQALVPVARTAGVEVILTTNFCRSAGTADPVAVALDLPLDVTVVRSPAASLAGCSPPIRAEQRPRAVPDPASVADHIRTTHTGRVVLVVGHSNTIPAIADALGALLCPEHVPPSGIGVCNIPDDAYGDVFIVRLVDGAATVRKARFGH